MSRIPSISIVIPTLNSEGTLGSCLQSIANQDYPRDRIEIIIADGGSKDRTVEIAKGFTKSIVLNHLKTGEAGKAVGVKEAKNEIIALIDSDNILDRRDWLLRMVEPFQDEEIAGSEPLYYTYRKQDSYITRYCALMGMNDPLCLFLGNYDRYCRITNKWTEMKVREWDRGGYLCVQLDERHLPTIGANGFLVRRELLRKCAIAEYLFDIDVVYELVKQGYTNFAKVDIGIVHIFSGSLSTFARKQRRRIRDHAYYKGLGLRKYPWSSLSKVRLLKFVLYTIFVVPLLAQVLRGYCRKRDMAWLFHLSTCWVTLLVYASETVRNSFRVKPEDRGKWQREE